MSVKTDVLVQIVLKEDDDKRKRTWTVSDATVNESVWHYMDLAANGTYTVPMGGIGIDTGAKVLYVETDQTLALNMTTATTHAITVEANGFFCAYVNQTLSPEVQNTGSATANVQIIVLEV